ncbi:unnamed protein product [Linum tenue]|uniref:Uncharacterized protein n=1 Tax=Linum tenue TaxID=586396 RepID=A0AAV0JUE5_9ROSI|nr:unnamed protein product [Linum tenue]
MASLIALRKTIAAPAGFFWRLTAGRSYACSRSFNTGTPGYAGDENDTGQVDNAPSRRNDDDSNRQGLSSSSDRGLAPRRDSAPAGFFLRDMVDACFFLCMQFLSGLVRRNEGCPSGSHPSGAERQQKELIQHHHC